MSEKTIEQIILQSYQQKADLFQALGQVECIKLAEILCSHSMKVSVLASHLGMEEQQVLKLLLQMQQAGVVNAHEHDGAVVYRMDAKAAQILYECVAQWISGLSGSHCSCGCH